MIIDKAINKLKPNKAPGRDITVYLYKQLNLTFIDQIQQN